MSSDTGTVIRQNKVRMLWHRVMFRGSELQVTVAAGGVGKILDFGIVANVRCPHPDGFAPGDIESVLVEFGKMLDATGAAVDKSLSETADVELDVWEPPEGWIPISEQDIQDWEPTKCEVIHLDVARRGG
jgi:hypothetical protein